MRPKNDVLTETVPSRLTPAQRRVPTTVFGIDLDPLDLEGLVEGFDRGLVVFHNLDTLRKVKESTRFRDVCRTADFSIVDGQVLAFVLRVLWRRPLAKASGSDFLPAFCERHRDDPSVTLFLLGAGPGVAATAARRINARVGREMVVGTHSPSFSLLEDPVESRQVVDLVDASRATVLAVALGAPKQETWMARHLDELRHVRRAIAVGATLDFEAGRVSRAPRWVSRLGLEWAYRLLQEPRRLWRRYLWEGPRTALAMAWERTVRPRRDSEATHA